MSPLQRDWLRLSLIPQLGPVTLGRLRSHFGDASRILAASSDQLRHAGLRQSSLQVLSGLRSGSDRPLQARLDEVDRWLAFPQHHLLSIDCDDYPSLLKEIDDPPPVLYVRGDPEVLQQQQIAVVGSRHASIYGREIAWGFARQLSLSGWVPTSGLALGIDGQAHQGGLDGLGLTVAVLGTGIDIIYPRRHLALAEQIVAEGGALVSEFPLGTAPRARLFPRRNRIISGLSRATLVVEAAPGSGSLITAKLALEQGREVFAIPGSVHNPLSKGCHQLIRQGAVLVEQVDHLFEELVSQLSLPVAVEARADKPLPILTISEQQLLELTGYEPTAIDRLVLRSGMETELVLATLLELELKGLIATVAGGYQRI